MFKILKAKVERSQLEDVPESTEAHNAPGTVAGHVIQSFCDITVEDLDVPTESGTSSSVVAEKAVSDVMEPVVEDLTVQQVDSGSVTEAPSPKTFLSSVTVAEEVVDAVESRSAVPTGSSSSWETISCCEVLSQTSVSSITETPQKKTPFFVFRRVKDLLNHLFTGAGRQRDGETTGSSGGSGSEETFTEGQFIEVIAESPSKVENLLLLVDSENTLSRRTCEMFSVDSRSSSKADDSSEEYETYSSSSSPENAHRPEEPKPQTVKKGGLGFRFIIVKSPPVVRFRPKRFAKVSPAAVVSDHHQPASTFAASQTDSRDPGTPVRTTPNRLSRIFSAIRRALPTPCPCMTGSP